MSGTRISWPSAAYTFQFSSTAQSVDTVFRRQSQISFGSLAGSTGSMAPQSSSANTLPRVQLVPYVHRLSYDSRLSESERDILDSTNFDALDVSSKDFDFDDIFTYDKPQRKLPSVVEVTSSKEKDWSTHSQSHFPSATAVRQKASRRGNSKGELYVKKKDTQKRS